MILPLNIRQRLSEKVGKELRTPADAHFLTLDIEARTGQHIGVNTMKRLLGMLTDGRNPRTSTLDILAQYLDFPNWEVMSKLLKDDNSNFDEKFTNPIVVEDLVEGTLVELSYAPDRYVLMRFLHDEWFEVVESRNSKLQRGDIIAVTQIFEGFPLMASKVMRDGKLMGSFMAGKLGGIKCAIVNQESAS